MNFENDQFLRRQQQIMQLELAEAAKVDQLSASQTKQKILLQRYFAGAEERQSREAC